MGLLISRTELFSQPAFLKKPFVFVVRYCHFSLINLLLLNYSTTAFHFTVKKFFFNYRFPTLFTYKESILFCSKFICLCFFSILLLLLLLFLFSLSLFLATSRPFPSSLPFFSSLGLDTEDVGQRLGAGLETSSLSCALPLTIHNITGALVSMHPSSCHTRVFPFSFTLFCSSPTSFFPLMKIRQFCHNL